MTGMGQDSPFSYVNAMQKMATKAKDRQAFASALGLALAYALRRFLKSLWEILSALRKRIEILKTRCRSAQQFNNPWVRKPCSSVLKCNALAQ